MWSIEGRGTIARIARIGRIASTVALVAVVVVGCGDDAPKERTSGERLVRGVLGVGDTASGREGKAADAVVSAIHQQFPGRIDQIDRDLRSQDAERVKKAKRLLDATINAASDSAFGGQGSNAGFALTTKSLRLLDDGSGNLTPGGSGQLVDHQGELVCSRPLDSAGQPVRLGRGSDGRFGDDRTGLSGAAEDALEHLAEISNLGSGGNNLGVLLAIDRGDIVPDSESRLGAYAATRGYPDGTVGQAVHTAIGTIFVALGTYGQEKIGRVFNAAEARALYTQPVDSCAGYQMAILEYQYWGDCLDEDSYSSGGYMGSMFSPRVRDLLQRDLFSE